MKERNQTQGDCVRTYKDLRCNDGHIVETRDLEEVFDDLQRPRRSETINGLVEAGLLTPDEAQAYVCYAIEGQSHEVLPFSIIEDLESAREKINGAQESLNIIEAYRSPKFPDTCSKCGGDLEYPWWESSDGRTYCCDCAGVDPEEEIK